MTRSVFACLLAVAGLSVAVARLRSDLLTTLRFVVGAAIALAFQQRILFEFALDIGDQIEVRQLQQLDGLHQLRRHHQRLALADFETL